jgi:hypothetical protein
VSSRARRPHDAFEDFVRERRSATDRLVEHRRVEFPEGFRAGLVVIELDVAVALEVKRSPPALFLALSDAGEFIECCVPCLSTFDERTDDALAAPIPATTRSSTQWTSTTQS